MMNEPKRNREYRTIATRKRTVTNMHATIRTAGELCLDKLYGINPSNRYRVYMVNGKEISLPFRSSWTIEGYLKAYPA